MINVANDLWGCAEGVLTRASPRVRIVCSVLVFSAVILAPLRCWYGAVAVVMISVLWLFLCWIPRWVLRGVVTIGAVLFLPYMLLTPVIAGSVDPCEWAHAWQSPAIVAARGFSGMLVCVCVACTLTITDIRDGLMRLGVPWTITTIVVQILQQTTVLVQETKSIAAAMALRTGGARGTTMLQVAVSLPKVWLPRVIVRAHRVADAMELRGYCEALPKEYLRERTTHANTVNTANVAAFSMALIAVAAVAITRWYCRR